WGHQRLCRTPVLDKLCHDAVVCTQAFSTSSITRTYTTSILICSYPIVHGFNTFVIGRLRPNRPTLADAFQASAYLTWGGMTVPAEPMTGLDRGFDEYRHRPYTEWLDTDFGDALIARLKAKPSTPWFGFLHLWEIHYPRRIMPEYNQP